MAYAMRVKEPATKEKIPNVPVQPVFALRTGAAMPYVGPVARRDHAKVAIRTTPL